MSSHFYISLDTTAPIINIETPNHSFKEGTDRIVVDSNEKLSSFQDIYAIDSEGTRHEFNFRLSEDGQSYVGKISFNNFSYGIATVYIRLSDNVGNITDVHTVTLNVISALIGNYLTTNLSVKTFITTTSNNAIEPETKIDTATPITKIDTTCLDTKSKTMNLHTFRD